VPCGIAGCRATSVEQVLGRGVDFAAAAQCLAGAFGSVFGLGMETVPVEGLAARLEEWERAQAPAAVPVNA